MLFYRNTLPQNLFTCLLCCFIVTLCHKICSPTYHGFLSYHFVTKFVHPHTMLFYRNILSQNLFSYLPCCFIVIFCHKTVFTYLPYCALTYNILSQNLFTNLPMLFYPNILSRNMFAYLPCCFIVTFWDKICSATYHAVLS